MTQRITAITLERDAAVNFRNDLVRIIRETLGLPEKIAVPMADELSKGLQKRLGGLYIPAREIRAVRDDAVRRDFNGRNHAEVISAHNISRATLYNILRRSGQAVRSQVV
jgi:Mor family transcriptional regulator